MLAMVMRIDRREFLAAGNGNRGFHFTDTNGQGLITRVHGQMSNKIHMEDEDGSKTNREVGSKLCQKGIIKLSS
jgi:hypothetical protein